MILTGHTAVTAVADLGPMLATGTADRSIVLWALTAVTGRAMPAGSELTRAAGAFSIPTCQLSFSITR